MDVSGTEQLSLVVRYFDKNDKCIKEDFLGCTLLEHGLDAGHVADSITSTLITWGLNLNNAVDKGCDSCSMIAGHITCMSLYFHCSSQPLNLVMNDINYIPKN